MGFAMKEIPNHFPTEFSTSWDLLTQQKMSQLREIVTVDTEVMGKEKKYNQIGSVEFQQVTARARQTVVTDVPLGDRWLRPFPYDVSNVFDEYDDKFLGKIVLPTSRLTQAHAAGYNRLCDRVLIDAISGNAYTGTQGVTPVALPASQKIVVDFDMSGTPTGTPTQITLEKLIGGKGLFGTNKVDKSDPLTFIYNQQALNVLLLEAKTTNNDYAAVKALVNGEIDYFLGMKWVRSDEDLPITGNVRSLFIVAKSGIVFAPSEKETYMDVLPTQSHALQIRSVCAMGATRMEEVKVVEILCDESAALPA